MAGQGWQQSKVLPWQLVQFLFMDWNSLLVWFQVLLLLCSDMVQASVSFSNRPPSETFILEPTPSMPSSPASTVQQLPNAISTDTPLLNSTSSIVSTLSQSYSGMMSSYVTETSQEMTLVSTPAPSLFSSSSSSIISMTTLQTMMSSLPASVPHVSTPQMLSPSLFLVSSQYSMHSTYSDTMIMLSLSPTPSIGFVSQSSSETIYTIVPDITSVKMELKSTLVTLSPTPSATKFLSSTSSSSASVTMVIPPLSKTPLVPTIYPSVLSSTPSQPVVPTRTSTSTTVPDLSSLSSSSSPVVVMQTPTLGPSSRPSSPLPTTENTTDGPSSGPSTTEKTTVGPSSNPSSGPQTTEKTTDGPSSGPSSRPPTTEKSSGPLTMTQWIGVAVTATFVAVIILCVIIWWLLKAGRNNSKHKPTYSIHNVTIDYSRSTSNDPKDVWRNSLLLESMSTRIVVPEENDDEIMQANYAATNHAYEGLSDEDEPPSTSTGTLTRV